MVVRIIIGDARAHLRDLLDESVHCIVTSPPYYGLRDYGVAGQIGHEATPDAYVAEMVALFREARRVLRADGTLWLNIGDSYAASGMGVNPDSPQSIMQCNSNGSGLSRRSVRNSGIKPKDLIGIPWMLAFALRADGWYLRQDIIWAKPSPMPESVRDRCTKSHEYLFLLSKSERYYYDAKAVAEPSVKGLAGSSFSTGKTATHLMGRSSDRARMDGSTRNLRSVWSIASEPSSLPHFAMMPTSLAERCIKAGCPEGGTVLDPFGGAGTTGLVADRLQRNAVLIELNPDYAAAARARIDGESGLFAACGGGP